MLKIQSKVVTTQPARTFFNDLFKRKSKFFSEKKSPKNSFGKYEVIAEPWTVPLSERRGVPSSIPKPSYAQSSIPCSGPTKPEVKNKNQIECMRHSCILSRQVLVQARHSLKAGTTTDQLDEKLHQLIIDNGAYPSPLNYKGFPKSICTSINNVACHGIPNSRPLQDGDILNVDVTVFLNGYHGDCSGMFEIGEVDDEGRCLINATETCLANAISICKPNENFSSIGRVIEETAHEHGYGIIPAFVGHGIGTYFHGPPDIYHFGKFSNTRAVREIDFFRTFKPNKLLARKLLDSPANDYPGKMQPGMTFTIEPVLTQGGPDIEILEDGWTAVTTDNARTAQIEHTILITDNGCEILTR